MDESQSNHLKSYGIAFYSLQKKLDVKWLLNYLGGSFLIEYDEKTEQECIIRGVNYQIIANTSAEKILTIAFPSSFEISMSAKLSKRFA